MWGGGMGLIPLTQVSQSNERDSDTWRGSSLTYQDPDLPYQQFHGVSLPMWLAKPIYDA